MYESKNHNTNKINSLKKRMPSKKKRKQFYKKNNLTINYNN